MKRIWQWMKRMCEAEENQELAMTPKSLQYAEIGSTQAPEVVVRM